MAEVRRVQRSPDAGDWQSLSKRITSRLAVFRGRRLPTGVEFEDFVAEVFEGVLRGLPTFELRSRGEFWSWIQTLALRRWIDLHQQAKALQRRGAIGAGGEPPSYAGRATSPSVGARAREISSVLQVCVDRLENAVQREVYLLRYQDGLALETIADRLNRNVSTVRSDFKRARDQIHDCLRRRLDGYSSVFAT